jgi:hypothetical protein
MTTYIDELVTVISECALALRTSGMFTKVIMED